MRLAAALALIGELQERNTALQAENATLGAALQAARERVAGLEQRLAGLEAMPPSSAPPWAKANRKVRKEPAVPRRRRRADQNHGRPRGEPTPCVPHA